MERRLTRGRKQRMENFKIVTPKSSRGVELKGFWYFGLVVGGGRLVREVVTHEGPL